MEERIESLASLEKEYGTVEEQLSIFEELREALKKKIIIKFEGTYGHMGAKYINPETGGCLQRILQVRETAEADQVRKILSSKDWDMVKKESVDMVKLTNAVKLGVIDARIIQDAVKTTEVDKLCWKKVK